ncbi:MAG: threonine--tRNA ligase [Spirochaetes bacterium]|nr:MAG: threonine--tRNA ligase [Spirochaetota bacterium]
MAEHNRQEEKLLKLRHSTAHVMAEAVLQLFPDAKLGIGPPIENGFYYDFDLPSSLTPDNLEEIEKRMKEIVKQNHSFKRKIVSKAEARELFKNQPYKIELLDELPDNEEISVYEQGGFTDLCKGPHLDNTSEIDPEGFKLLTVAGAYWRGKERNPMLQRIYGTVWQSAKELRTHLQQLKEIEQRDHRKLGKELDLFSTHEEAGPGLIYWHPKGARIRLVIEDYWRREHLKNGYEILFTPHIGKAQLWETSGHLDFYRESMYSPMKVDEQDFYVKPMNCPFHILVYKSDIRSYRDLPMRWAELGTVYRYERSGVMHGLMRVRGFTQDDAHIICTPEQIEGEILEVLRFSLKMWAAFGFSEIKAYLATRPKKSVGDEKSWSQAVDSLEKAIEAEGLDYEVDEGGGAFYGPKIDLKVKDALGREWQMTTIQFDFNLPERFDMTFVDRDGREKRPYMVHRALLGSLERFFGVLIEHYGGAFPVWLAPLQAVVIPVAPPFNQYAEKVAKKLEDADIRVEASVGEQRMNAKIRDAQNKKVPYMLILGEKERSESTVSIRTRKGEQIKDLKIGECISYIQDKIDKKELL